MASTLCQEVQAQLMRMDETAETKEDRSLVTLADYAAQAIISWCDDERATWENIREAPKTIRSRED